MNVPTLIQQQYVDPKTGYLTPQMQAYHEQLNQQLQFSFSNSGLVVPSLNTQTINNVTNSNNPNAKPNGTVFHDEQTNELKVNLNGQIKTIQTA